MHPFSNWISIIHHSSIRKLRSLYIKIYLQFEIESCLQKIVVIGRPLTILYYLDILCPYVLIVLIVYNI